MQPNILMKKFSHTCMCIYVYVYSYTYSHIYIDTYTLFKVTRNKQSFLFLLLKALIKELDMTERLHFASELMFLLSELFLHHLKFKSYIFFYNLDTWDRETRCFFLPLCLDFLLVRHLGITSF